jgi:hypothetical protein
MVSHELQHSRGGRGRRRTSQSSKDGKLKIVSENFLFSSLDKFQITQPNTRKLNKLL